MEKEKGKRSNEWDVRSMACAGPGTIILQEPLDRVRPLLPFVVLRGTKSGQRERVVSRVEWAGKSRSSANRIQTTKIQLAACPVIPQILSSLPQVSVLLRPGQRRKYEPKKNTPANVVLALAVLVGGRPLESNGVLSFFKRKIV